MRPPSSLRRRLWLAGLVGVLLAALAAAWLLGAAFERAAMRSFDRGLDDDLDKLIGLVERLPDGRRVLQREPADERYDRVFSGWYWAVRDETGLRESRSAWDDAGLAGALDAAAAVRRHLSQSGPRGQRLRVVAQRIQFADTAQPMAFAVAGDLADVAAEVRDFRLFAGGSVALIALALLAVMTLQVGYGLRPLRQLGATLARLQRGDDARFEPARLPQEIAPLAQQVNELLDEHGRRIQRARHAADDLAHALKTPLAAIALESQADGGAFARRVAIEAARMQAVIDRRLASGLAADTRQRAALRPALEAMIALMHRVHASRGLAFDLDVEGEPVFAGGREDLEEMLGNLLDNAGKWARTRVRAAAWADAADVFVRIEDDGPGLPPEAADRATQRGVRLDEGAPGTGLGLAIVSSLAVAHGGELRLGVAPMGGLCAQLRFGRPRPPAPAP